MIQNSGLSGKKAILSITGNILTDQRVHKVALSLLKFGIIPTIAGRKLVKAPLLHKRLYHTKQFRLLFFRGPLFYAEYNIRLFLFLLFSKADILVSNDLDTLLANYMAWRIKRICGAQTKLVYDSHELFTEVPELNHKKMVKKIWLLIEGMILPKLKNTYTVCSPIAEYYNQKYGTEMKLIRNMPVCNNTGSSFKLEDLNIKTDKKIILYQGALNIGRGIEHIIPAMEHIDNAIFVIVGSGDIESMLRQMVRDKKLDDRVIFTGRLSLEQLNSLTPIADIGLVLQEDISLSYHFVLPNRLFDFINAGVPVLASCLPELEEIVNHENVGIVVKGFEQEVLIQSLQMMLGDEMTIQKFKAGLMNCKGKYCWENQESVLFNLYHNLKN